MGGLARQRAFGLLDRRHDRQCLFRNEDGHQHGGAHADRSRRARTRSPGVALLAGIRAGRQTARDRPPPDQPRDRPASLGAAVFDGPGLRHRHVDRTSGSADSVVGARRAQLVPRQHLRASQCRAGPPGHRYFPRQVYCRAYRPAAGRGFLPRHGRSGFPPHRNRLLCRRRARRRGAEGSCGRRKRRRPAGRRARDFGAHAAGLVLGAEARHACASQFSRMAALRTGRQQWPWQCPRALPDHVGAGQRRRLARGAVAVRSHCGRSLQGTVLRLRCLLHEADPLGGGICSRAAAGKGKGSPPLPAPRPAHGLLVWHRRLAGDRRCRPAGNDRLCYEPLPDRTRIRSTVATTMRSTTASES